MSEELKQLARVLDGIAEGREWEYFGDVGRQEIGWFTAHHGESPLVYIGLNREIRLKPESQKVPLGPDDVPPGTVLRGAGEAAWPEDKGWCMIVSSSHTGIRIWHHSDGNGAEITWQTLMDAESQIWRPTDTGWQPCWKEIKV